MLAPRRSRSRPHLRPVIERLEDRLVLTALPSGFAENLVASGLDSPTAMEFSPDGRLFVAEQTGRLRVIRDGALLPTPFVTLPVDPDGERGLLGVTFDPDFATNSYVYVYYTVPGFPAHNRLSRFTAAGDVAQAGSEHVVLELDPLGSIIHNGGAIHFGLDGKLYVAVGDNVFAPHAERLDTLFGKVLRINADGSIPADNPYYHLATGNNRAAWAVGLRNPFTFAVQPGTGLMFINDVGDAAWEEINQGYSGAHFGWPRVEGPSPGQPYQGPLFAYPHSGLPDDQIGCAITGGAFYDPTNTTFPPDYLGDYFFADYCNNWVRRLDVATNQVTTFATDLTPFTVDLKVGPDGALYSLSRDGGGVVNRIQFTDSQAPSIGQHPADQTVAAGQPATFTVAASGAAPLSYQWRRNGADIPGATQSSYTLAAASLADSGARFRAVVTNAFGSATSHEATLTVQANSLPTPTITAPAPGLLYQGGQTFAYAGTGTDPEDGTLPPSAFTWRVDFHHDDHVHPFLPDTPGAVSGQFTIPTVGETATDVFYRVHLTVRDAAGLTSSTSVDIQPRLATIKLLTKPNGLSLRLDGQPVTSPKSVLGVVGIQRVIEALTPQTGRDGKTYAFSKWSDRGAREHTISFSSTTTAYTASYVRVAGGSIRSRAQAPLFAVTDDGRLVPPRRPRRPRR